MHERTDAQRPQTQSAPTTTPSGALVVQKKKRSDLGDMSFTEQEALFAPPPVQAKVVGSGGQPSGPSVGHGPVQMVSGPGDPAWERAHQQEDPNDKRTKIEAIDETAYQTFLDVFSGINMKFAIEEYAKETCWGYVPMTDEAKFRVGVLIQTELRDSFRFVSPASKGTFLQAFEQRLYDEVHVRTLKRAPTEVWGRVLSDVKLADEKGQEVTLTAGRVVKLKGGESGKLQVEGQIANKPVTGTVPVGNFQREPGLNKWDHDNKESTPEIRQEYPYMDMAPGSGKELTKDGADPKAADVGQGHLGDCYLMAGMGAVAAARADLIKKMIKYDASSRTYTVTFKEKAGADYKDVPIKVTAWVPTSSGKSPIYAQDESTKGGDNQALWPAIVEKAYAVWKGDYQAIDGGNAGQAMEAITGAKSDSPAIPAEDKVIALFKQFQSDKKAVCASTINDVAAKQQGEFMLTEYGAYITTLKGSGTKAATIVTKSVRVSDGSGVVKAATDDGDGAMQGPDVGSGTVSYKGDTGGQVSLSYKDGKQPKSEKDLTAEYRYKRLISESLNLFGCHFYMFVGVKDDMLIFQNPWGPRPDWQPQPIPAKDFKKFFDGISVNAPPTT